MVVLLNVGSPSNPSLVQVAMSFVSLSTLECYLAARKDIKGHSLKPKVKIRFPTKDDKMTSSALPEKTLIWCAIRDSVSDMHRLKYTLELWLYRPKKVTFRNS